MKIRINKEVISKLEVNKVRFEHYLEKYADFDDESLEIFNQSRSIIWKN